MAISITRISGWSGPSCCLLLDLALSVGWFCKDLLLLSESIDCKNSDTTTNQTQTLESVRHPFTLGHPSPLPVPDHHQPRVNFDGQPITG